MLLPIFVRAQEPGQVRSRALDRIDTALAEAARTARTAGIGAEELRDRLAHALEEEDR